MTAPAGHLFGRARELAVLRSGLVSACAGTGGLVVVAGPPGIGRPAHLTESII